MNNLLKWIEGESDSEELLPLCHTTRWLTFEKILEQKVLSYKFSKFPQPNPFKSIEDQMIYLFYGMPFYIYEFGVGDAVNSQATEDMPIGLIFKPQLSNLVDRFYPFDTGALFSDLYRKLMSLNSDEELKLFQSPISNGCELQKTVKRYFCENINYCFGRPCDKTQPIHPNEERLIRLQRNSAKERIDIRSRAIEVHALNNITLADYLQAIILPRHASKTYQYLEDKISTEYNHIDIVKYNDFGIFTCETIRQALMDRTIEYYDQNTSMKFKLN